MKFNKFIYATMAAALLAACSDKDVVADGPDTGTITVPEGGDGYVAVRINLPTQPVATPRAVNDNFDDGTANEYAVNNGALLLFTGTDEKTAVFKSAYSLNLDPWVSAPDEVDNITTSSLVSVKITNPATASDKIYGLVVLNYTNVMTVGSDNKLTIAGSSTPFTGDFETFARTVSQQPFYTGSGTTASNFFMINAPVSNKIAQNGSVAPTANDITTLVNITDGVKATRAEAEANPAGSFFVERAVAKTTLSTNPTVGAPESIIDNTGAEITFTVKSVEWALEATNTKSFIVRNMYPADGQKQFIGYKNPKNGGYRMVGNTKIGETIIQPTVDLYRTYWCYDPNYSSFTEGDLLHTDMTSVSFVPADGTKHPLYCYENTFDIDHQTHQYTTQALVKVTFELTKDGSKINGFYTVNERQNVIYGEADAKANSIAAIIRDSRIADALQTALDGTGQSISITADNYDQYLTVTFADPDANGIVKVSKVEFVDGCLSSIDGAKQPAFADGDEAKLIDDVNKQVRITEYTDNVAYYSIRIKHFAGDNYNDTNDLAPWNAEFVPVGASSYDYEKYNPTVAAEKAGDAENMWLGRYGMVRNNWYDITVSSVKKLGAATIPGLDVKGDDNKDDEVEQWIAFKVNILSWAKRTQNVEL